jgi:hypothetical protein
MNRRDAISRVALILGVSVVGGDLFLSGCKSSTEAAADFVLSENQVMFLNEVGETILPATAGSGGAKAAKVGQFMQVMVRDCYAPEDQEVFLSGLEKIDNWSKEVKGKEFLKCTPAERTEVLVKLNDDLKEYKKKNELLKQQELQKEKASQAGGKPNYLKKSIPDHYFSMVKQLTLLGYFTSEVGYKAQGYVSVPGRYDGDVRHPESSAA